MAPELQQSEEAKASLLQPTNIAKKPIDFDGKVADPAEVACDSEKVEKPLVDPASPDEPMEHPGPSKGAPHLEE